VRCGGRAEKMKIPATLEQCKETLVEPDRWSVAIGLSREALNM